MNTLTFVLSLRLNLAQCLINVKVLCLRLFHNNRVRLSARPDLKESIHLVKRHSLSLGDKEPNKRQTAKGDTAKQEVHAVSGLAHAIDHIGSDASDDERPEPVCHRREQLSDVTGALAEHFCVDDPRSSVPGIDVDGSPEVYHEHGRNTRGRQRSGRRSVGVHSACDKGADNEHRDRATDSSEEQKLATAPFVDEDSQPEDGHNGLDDAEETSRKVDRVLASYAN